MRSEKSGFAWTIEDALGEKTVVVKELVYKVTLRDVVFAKLATLR